LHQGLSGLSDHIQKLHVLRPNSFITMRILTWNGNRAFRNKASKLIELEPDIAVIPESEDPEHHKDKFWLSFFKEFRWIGDNKNQGFAMR